MRTIYKYTLQINDSVAVGLPKGAEVLCIQPQASSLYLWALVDPEQPIEQRVFQIVGTGHPTEMTKASYIETVQLFGGSLVYHIFELDRVSDDPQ